MIDIVCISKDFPEMFGLHYTATKNVGTYIIRDSRDDIAILTIDEFNKIFMYLSEYREQKINEILND